MLYKNIIQLFEMPFMLNNMYYCRRTFLHEVNIYTKSAVRKKSAEFRTSGLKLISINISYKKKGRIARKI